MIKIKDKNSVLKENNQVIEHKLEREFYSLKSFINITSKTHNFDKKSVKDVNEIASSLDFYVNEDIVYRNKYTNTYNAMFYEIIKYPYYSLDSNINSDVYQYSIDQMLSKNILFKIKK